MELLEYQAKKLFHQVGIPVLPSETIANPRNLKQLQIPYPVVLKSQVKAGGRGKAGGVKFVNNTIDAIAQARGIFNLSILGEYPEVILAEARYNARKELFLGVVLDYELQRPVIFGSCSGGMDVDLLLENLQQIVVEREFFPFLARRLSVMMGLSGNLLLSVSEIIEKMYHLFRTKDLDFIEINPLGVDEEGQLMALDGKITLSDCALEKHPELIDLTVVENSSDEISQLAKTSSIRWLDWQNSQGKIALVTNDDELALLNWDLLSQRKTQPGCAVIIEPISSGEQLLQEQLQQILTRLESQDSITVILINLWSTEAVYKAIANTLLKLCKSRQTAPSIAEEKTIIPINRFHLRRSSTESKEKRSLLESIKFVIRLPQQDIESYQTEFAHEAIIWVNNLEDAISETISYAQTT